MNAIVGFYTMSLLDLLPGELLDGIASDCEPVYLGLALAYPRFARSLTNGRRFDWMERFGHDCVVEDSQCSYGRRLSWRIPSQDDPSKKIYHRIGGPACQYASGSEEWYECGKIHRIGGPARSIVGDYTAWFQHDRAHRTDGPAYVWDDGTLLWWQYGQYHRIDGPAIENHNVGRNVWFLYGIRMCERWHALYTMEG